MFNQINEEGHRQLLLDKMINHRNNPGKTMKYADSFVTSANDQKRRKTTTAGWEILMQWKDGSTTWVNLKECKDFHPVQLAEYATNNNIVHEPVFAWWVPYVLKKKDIIISKVESMYWQTTHRYGIRLSKSIKEAKELDQNNINTLWWDDVVKEMQNVRIVFEDWNNPLSEMLPRYSKLTCHLIFEIKLSENFRRKARFVADGHKHPVKSSLSYSTVVSRDSMCIASLLAALNSVEIISCDIQNAYLSAPCREKFYYVAGDEFGSEKGKVVIVKRALYGLRTSGAAFRTFLAESFHDMGFKPCNMADPDVWIRANRKLCGDKYYEYFLAYV